MRKLVLPLWIGLMVVLAIYANTGSQSGEFTTRFDTSDGKMVALIGAAILWYWIPTVIVMVRGASTGVFVALVNLFTGWTGIGWFVALFFSFLGKRQD